MGGKGLSLKKFTLFQTLSPLFHFVQFAKWRWIILGLNSKILYQTLEKEKKNRSCTPNMRTFPVVFVQRRQRNVKTNKQNVLSLSHLLILNLRFFSCSRCRCWHSPWSINRRRTIRNVNWGKGENFWAQRFFFADLPLFNPIFWLFYPSKLIARFFSSWCSSPL